MAKLERMTDEELEAKSAELAEQKRAIREEQNAVDAELETRRAIAQLSGPARRIVEARLAGKSDSAGSAQGGAR